MKKLTVILILVCMLLCACRTVTPPNADDTSAVPETTVLPQTILPLPETTQKPETTAKPEETTTPAPETTAPPIDIIPDITLWDREPHVLTDLLSMTVFDIKANYGDLTLVSKDSMADRSVYSAQKLAGVHLIFENRDMTLPLEDVLVPDKIKLSADYDGEIAGVAIGKTSEGVIWNDAFWVEAPMTLLIGRDYVIYATYEETDETFPQGYPGLDNQKAAMWRESFCKDPVGKIIDISIEKKKKTVAHGELKVISNANNTSVHDLTLPLRTAHATYEVFDLDDRYALYVVKNKNLWQITDNETDVYTVELFVIDALEGRIVYNEEIAKVSEKSGYGGCYAVLLHTTTGGELALWEGPLLDKLITAYDLSVSENGVNVQKKDSAMALIYRERHTSPDGKYTVFTVREKADEGDGGIDLLMPDGSLKRVFENYDPNSERSEGYRVYGFIDNTTFVYSIWGWEHTKGYGTYNIETGENEEFRGDDDLIAAKDGYIYVRESKRVVEGGLRTFTSLHSISPSGARTRIASTVVITFENGNRVYVSDVKAGEVNLTRTRYFLDGSGWIVIGDTVNFYSKDFSKLYVSIDAPTDNTGLYDNVHVYNRIITLVTPRYAK